MLGALRERCQRQEQALARQRATARSNLPRPPPLGRAARESGALRGLASRVQAEVHLKTVNEEAEDAKIEKDAFSAEGSISEASFQPDVFTAARDLQEEGHFQWRGEDSPTSSILDAFAVARGSLPREPSTTSLSEASLDPFAVVRGRRLGARQTGSDRFFCRFRRTGKTRRQISTGEVFRTYGRDRSQSRSFPAMTVVRLHDLPEPVLELLMMMCLVDAAYDCTSVDEDDMCWPPVVQRIMGREHAAKLFRAHFDGNTAAEDRFSPRAGNRKHRCISSAEEFTGDAVRGILREMVGLAFSAAGDEFVQPAQLNLGAPGIDNSTLDEPPAEAPNTWSLDDVMLATWRCTVRFLLTSENGCTHTDAGVSTPVPRTRGKGSIPAMRASRRFRSVGLAVKNFWQQAVFVEATSVRRPARGVRAERVRLGVVKRGERAGSDVRHREGTELSSAAERLQKRLGNFVEQHAQQVEEMALRNTAVAPFWKQAAESLLKVENLQRCFTTSCFTALQRLILHSFKSLFPKLERLELFQCWLGAGNFLDTGDLAELPALSSLGIWGLKNTQISLPDRWPSFRLDELCLDPVEATAWPRLGGATRPFLCSRPRSLQRLHLCTSRPRLALASVPTSLQVLSLTTSAQANTSRRTERKTGEFWALRSRIRLVLRRDLSNPFVEAFVLLDEHVQQLLPSLPQLVDLVLSGHVRLGPCSRAGASGISAKAGVEITDAAQFWPEGRISAAGSYQIRPAPSFPSPPLTVSSGPIGPSTSMRLTPPAAPVPAAPLAAPALPMAPALAMSAPPTSALPAPPGSFGVTRSSGLGPPIPTTSAGSVPAVPLPPWPEFRFTAESPKGVPKETRRTAAGGRELRDMAADVRKLSQGQEQLWQEFEHLKREAQHQNQYLSQLKGHLRAPERPQSIEDPPLRARAPWAASAKSAPKPTTDAADGEAGAGEASPEPKKGWDDSFADCLLCGK
ncbi:unnamed protein product [Durusdinium trenchii]